ncbi:MAG: response regulator [Saprospiraceae bacterium]
MRYFTLLITTLALSLSFQLTATQPYAPEVANPLTESWRWRHFPELEGKGVRCIVEDKHGIMWFGVNEGIMEYNGFAWKWHNEDNGLKGSRVEQLYASKKGAIYATTTEGLFVFEGRKWQHIVPLDSSLNITFLQIRELSNGNLMLCMDRGAIEIQHNRAIRIYTIEANEKKLANHLPNTFLVRLPEAIMKGTKFMDISDVLEVKQGLVWMSVTVEEQSLILQFKPEKINSNQLEDYTLISAGKQHLFGETQKMLKSQDSTIWIINSSNNIGIHTYDGKHWDYLELSNLFGGDEYMTDIVQSSDGTIWAGALGKLFTYKAGNWQLYKAPTINIPANRLMFIPSRNNNIWIGGYKSKVYRLDYSSSRWKTYNNLNFQCESNSNEWWFLDVQGRVIKKVGKEWTAYDQHDGLIDAPVRLIATSKQQIWVAGSHQGVAATAYYDNGKWHRQLHPTLSWGIDYRAVFEAANGSLWFGAGVDFFKSKGQLGGVLQLQDPTASEFTWIHHKYHENGLIQSNAYGIGQSPDGRIWIGGGNLFYFDGQSWDRPEQSYLRQIVNIVQSANDMLLVGSRYYGIFIYDGKTWKQYDTAAGLTSNTIISLHTDAHKSIWVATENDIAHFDGHRWISHVFPPEMNMNVEGGSILSDQDGSIWINKSSREWTRRAFSSNKMQDEANRGFVVHRYIPDTNPPDTRIELFNEEVSSKGNMLVSWTAEDFFQDTPDDRLLFSYRINGEEWSPYSEETHHTFMNLPSGNYTLEVRSRDMDFNVDPIPASINFVVHPPLWKQGWFLSLMLAFLITLCIFEYRVISKNQKLERLNNSLNSINEELKHKNDQVLQQQQQILVQKQALEKSYANLEGQHIKIQSQHHKLEEMVTQIEKLSRSKIDFFTNISHELRTPLTLIIGPVEQLQNEEYPLSKKEKDRLLDIIERNAYRLVKLINQLLEMRRIEENTLELHLSKGNLAQFLEEVTNLFDNLARNKFIHLSFQNRCHNAMTRFDPDKIEKIVANLLSNAFKHTPEGGRISLVLEEEHSPALEGEKAFKITIEDTGSGINPKKLGRIFERYYCEQQDQSSSGIGLSYIKDLVELHQGQIRVQSEEGNGTIFTLFIPANLPANDVEIEKLTLIPESLQVTAREVQYLSAFTGHTSNGDLINGFSPKSQRILIVEDNEDILDFLAGLLRRKYSILKATNGIEGLHMAQNHHIDLILSDVMMPEMDGLEFCKNIKTNLATSHIPVVLLTARGMEEHIMGGFEIGADDYVTRPFNPQLLEIRINNLLNQRELLRKKFTRDFALTPKEVELTSPDEELLNRMVEIMEEHIADSTFNVNKMCEMVHLSHMHFIRKVKQLTGKKPIDLLKSYRLKRAKDLLKQNKANISEVAYMVGYDLPNSFSRAFKKEFGLSPTEYMESLMLHTGDHHSTQALPKTDTSLKLD